MRDRMLRHGFWSSPHHPASPWARLLFMAMWNFADDYGVGSCSTRELLGFAFPNDRHVGEGDLEILLQDVGIAYGVIYYTVAGRPYYCIPSWESHQRVPHPAKARNPSPESAETWLYRVQNDGDLPIEEMSCDPHESRMTATLESPQVSVNLSDKYKYKEKEKEKDPPPSSVGQATKRGTRLSDDWRPPQDVAQQLAAKYPDTRLDLILAEFINYWTSLPGARATKLDWTKTFVNRVNERATATQFQISNRTGRPLTGTEVAYAKLTALAKKYGEDDNAELPAGGVTDNDEGQGVLAVGKH